MKKILLSTFLLAIIISCKKAENENLIEAEGSNFECDILTNNRPDGNVIKYFNPVPVAINDDYELGLSIYKNETINEIFVSAFIMFKNNSFSNLKGDLIIQTDSPNSISLKQSTSNKVEMNGRIFSVALYKITENDLEILKESKLKMVAFNLEDSKYGETITKNSGILLDELNCFYSNY